MVKNVDQDMPHIWGGVSIPALTKYEDYAYELTREKFDEEEWALTRAANDYIHKNRGRERYSRIRGSDTRCLKNRVAMFTPPSSGVGYLTFQDKRYWDFITDLRNLLFKEADERDKVLCNTLLVNYCKKYYYVPEIVPMANYRVNEADYDPAIMKAWSDALDISFTRSFQHCIAHPEKVRLRNEKTTTMGFPYEKLDGTPVQRDDILFGREIDKDFRKTRFLMDWSGVKQEWRESDDGCRRIFGLQMEFINSGAEINPANIGTLMDNSIVTVCSEAQRENCPDNPINVKDVYKPEDIITGKDRRMCVITPKGEIISGTMHGEVYNAIAQKETGMPGATNRERKIYPSNNMMHTNGTVLAKATLHSVESSCKGNPSTRPSVLQDWKTFARVWTEKGRHIDVLAGDCVNAEVTVTTNFKTFINLTPERFRKWLNLTSFSIHPYHQSVVALKNAYCSAVWYTTWFHVCKGNFELMRLTYYIVKANRYEVYPLAEIARAYAILLFNADDIEFVKQELGEMYDAETHSIKYGPEVAVNPKLATDDMICQVASTRGIEVTKEIEELAKRDQLSIELNPSEPAFGMKLDPMELSENVSSRIAKLFTSEHMGFTFRDGMSTYVRCENCGYTEVVDFVLRKHFGYTHLDYAPYVGKFMQFLSSLGITVEDVMNFYSPVERLTFGQYVDSSVNPALKSSAVKPEVVSKFLTMLDEAFWR